MTTSTVSELYRELDRGGLAITSTRRLARQVEHRYAHWKIETGAGAWPTPRVRDWDDWLRGIWQAAFEHLHGVPRLLTEDQELLLWEQTIRRRTATANVQPLLQLSGTARASAQSWRRIHDWELDPGDIRSHGSADTEAFMDWAGAVRRTLADRNWLTPAQLPRYLVEHAADWLPARGRPARWLGFEVMTPAMAAVWTVLEEHGLPQKSFVHAGIDGADVRVVSCDDDRDEWRRIAQWARTELNANPRIRLGVVCPDLHRRRDGIEEILEDVLHPDLAWRVDAPRAFHVSLGRPLAEYAMIGSALDLLHWTARRIPFEVISRTLRSPYAGSEDDIAARMDFDVALRSMGRESFSIRYLETLAGGRQRLEHFARLLGAARRLDAPEQDSPAGWAAFVSDWLRAFNWPGDRSLDSHEYQVLNAWREQLSRFAALNTIRDRWSLPDAIKKLSAMTSDRVLQFHDDQAPLQIMGAGEASGLWFDGIWLADMSDAVWPPPVQPDPFIPIPLQKERGIPEASAQSVLAHTRVRTAALMANAPRVVISFAPGHTEPREALSPLFLDCPAGEPAGSAAYGGRTEQLLDAGPELEIVDDHHAPPLRDRDLRGGVALLADQARCPFRAFVHHRLNARDMEEVLPGLDPPTRGRLTHDAVRRLWDRLGDSDALNRLDDTELDALVAEASSGALAGEAADSTFQRRFLDIERERLMGLLREWLSLEAQRPWFRVLETETAMHVELGDARFDIRADRIDELADGRRMIIDYKTGRSPSVVDWADPRMEDPQLPIYALGIREDVAALVLANLRTGECQLRGIAEHVADMPSLKSVTELGFPGMAELRSWWGSALGGLVDAHRNGDARVDPKNSRTCRHCDAMPLCRIFERGDSVG